jgi:hypothetical protein
MNRLQTFIDDVGLVVSSTDDEYETQNGLRSDCPICWPAATGFCRSSRDHPPRAT